MLVDQDEDMLNDDEEVGGEDVYDTPSDDDSYTMF